MSNFVIVFWFITSAALILTSFYQTKILFNLYQKIELLRRQLCINKNFDIYKILNPGQKVLIQGIYDESKAMIVSPNSFSKKDSTNSFTHYIIYKASGTFNSFGSSGNAYVILDNVIELQNGHSLKHIICSENCIYPVFDKKN